MEHSGAVSTYQLVQDTLISSFYSHSFSRAMSQAANIPLPLPIFRLLTHNTITVADLAEVP